MGSEIKSTVGSIDGFYESEEYHPSYGFAIALNFVVLATLGEVFFPGVLATFFSIIQFGPEALLRFALENWWDVTAFVVFTGALVLVHELIHTAAHKANGFDSSYGVTLVWSWKIPNPVPYVVVLDQHIPRLQNIAGLIAPLVVLNLIGIIGLLSIFPPTVTHFAKLLLVLNTAGSSSDIVNSLKVAQYSPGTLFLNVDDGGKIRTFTYEPKGEY